MRKFQYQMDQQKNFIEKIVSTGLKISNAPIKIIKINKKIEFKDGKRNISIAPSKLSLDIDYELKYQNPLIGNQRIKSMFMKMTYKIYLIQNFLLFEDIEMIKKKWTSVFSLYN